MKHFIYKHVNIYKLMEILKTATSPNKTAKKPNYINVLEINIYYYSDNYHSF